MTISSPRLKACLTDNSGGLWLRILLVSRGFCLIIGRSIDTTSLVLNESTFFHFPWTRPIDQRKFSTLLCLRARWIFADCKQKSFTRHSATHSPSRCKSARETPFIIQWTSIRWTSRANYISVNSNEKLEKKFSISEFFADCSSCCCCGAARK